MPDSFIIVDYDQRWPSTFLQLRRRLSESLADLPVAIEHIGSTAIPGASAKPIIDIDIVVQSEDSTHRAILLLERAGYRHVGDLGIKGREAFDNPPGLPPHHLYVVVSGNSAHSRHLAFRDYLRNHPEEIEKYSELKKSLALRYRNDREGYTEAKTQFVEGILRKAGFLP